jgi:serine/threonine-protein kinase
MAALSPARRAGIGRIGRYDLVEPLGVGGMAEVFKARTTGPSGFERTVVVKRIHPDFSHDREFIGMFVAEARILGLLHHANVVQAYDFGEANGALFMVLEFVDGPSIGRAMRRLVSRNEVMPFAIAAHFAREVCHALDYIHSLQSADGTPLNVIHRDVTPSNIVLTSAGSAKLLDFGVAKYATSKVRTRHRRVKGKPAYLAPEALEGSAIDGRVDVFSLGVVLHEMLTLSNLFAGDDELVIIRKALTMPIEPPSRRRPDIPPELDAIVLKALARDLDARYASAAEMARDLDEVVVASQLRVAELGAFVRSVMDAPPPAGTGERLWPPLRAPDESPTLRLVPSSRTGRFRASRLGRWLLGDPAFD